MLSHLSLPVNLCFSAHLDLISLTMCPKPNFNLTNIYILGTVFPKMFLKCCFACSQTTIYVWEAMTWYGKISKRQTLKFALQNYSASFSVTHRFESKRTLVPGLKAFTLDVTVSPLSLALCLLNYLLHAGEGDLQSCVGTCLDSAVPPTPLLLSVILFHIVNKRIRKVKHN